MKIAVIYFPGINCERETKTVCEAVGMEAEIVRWNTHDDISKFDGFVIPGGWSYEDRIRAGVISAKDPLMEKIKNESKKGKPVLGICNGCQVLVESGIIPGLKDHVQMALAPNINPFVQGYYCTWVRIKNVSGKNAFNRFLGEDVIDLPIAHGEGRFTTKDDYIIKRLEQNNQIAFKYCDKDGNIIENFPINPNGSMLNIAGITNKEGNVLAMMPHPERAFFKRQLKEKEMKTFEDSMAFAKAAKIFESIREYINEN